MGLFGDLFGPSSSEKNLAKTANAFFESERLQKFLPPELRMATTGPILKGGLESISELLRRPGGLSPTVSEAILPRLAVESENIAQNYRGIGSNQAGAAARGNLPISIKNALQAALDVAQERAQRGARREALGASESLRRTDLEHTYRLLEAILQFLSSGRGQAIQGLGTTAGLSEQRRAGNLQLLSAPLQAASGGLF